jgi:hypothetical protein
MLFRVEHPGTLPNLRNETGRDIFSVQRNHQGMVFFFKNGPLNLQVQDLLSLFKSSHSAWNFGLPSGKCRAHQNVLAQSDGLASATQHCPTGVIRSEGQDKGLSR